MKIKVTKEDIEPLLELIADEYKLSSDKELDTTKDITYQVVIEGNKFNVSISNEDRVMVIFSIIEIISKQHIELDIINEMNNSNIYPAYLTLHKKQHLITKGFIFVNSGVSVITVAKQLTTFSTQISDTKNTLKEKVSGNIKFIEHEYTI